MWLKVLTVFLTLEVSRGNLISVEKNNNSAISSYIHNLLAEYETKTKSTNDVVVFKMNKVDSLSDEVDDLYEGICKSIPKSMPFHLSPLGVVVEYRNLRPTSFTIIVSSESNPVSITRRKAIRKLINQSFRYIPIDVYQ